MVHCWGKLRAKAAVQGSFECPGVGESIEYKNVGEKRTMGLWVVRRRSRRWGGGLGVLSGTKEKKRRSSPTSRGA